MDKKHTNPYVSPEVEILEVSVEAGIAASGDILDKNEGVF